MAEQIGTRTPGQESKKDPKVLICAMNPEGRVVASMRVDPVPNVVELARDVMTAVSPVVHEYLVGPASPEPPLSGEE